jgi:hypothetical protein
VNVFVQQPQFLPWIGFWHKVWSADVYIMYAGVQYVRSEYQNRVRYLEQWLTLPVHHTLGQPICEVSIVPTDVHKIGVRLQQTAMAKDKPYRCRLKPLVDRLRSWESDSFLDLHVETYRLLALELGIDTTLVVDRAIREGEVLDKLQQSLQAAKMSEITLLAGTNCRDFGYEQIPEIQSVFYQALNPGLNPESLLTLLVVQENPLQVIRRAATWIS